MAGTALNGPHPTIASLTPIITDSANSNLILMAYCTGTPDTTASTYQHGAIMIQTDTGTGSKAIYQNTGSTAVPAWTLVDTGVALTLPGSFTDATNGAPSLGLTQNSVTTGSGITQALNGLTTGTGHLIGHTTSVIADGGSLLRITSTSIDTGGATNATLLDISSTSQVAGKIAWIQGGAMTTGVLLNLSTTTGLTSGSVLRATTSSAGAIATNGAFSFTGTGAFTNSSATLGLFHVAGASTVSGTIFSVLGGSQTTGVAVSISDGGATGMTSGSLLRVATATTGAVATNGIVSIVASGAYTSTSNAGILDVSATSTVTGTLVHLTSTNANQTTTQILNITQSGVTTGFTGNAVQITGSSTTGTGTTLNVTGVNTAAGNTVNIVNNAALATAGTGLLVSHSSANPILDGGSLVRITSASADTGGATNGSMLDMTSAATTGVSVLLTVNALTTGSGLSIISSGASQTSAVSLKVVQSGTTTGFTGSVVSFTGSSTTGAGNTLQVTGVNTTTGDTVKVINNALVAGTSTAMLISHTTSVLGAGNSLLRISSTSVDTGTTTGTLLDLASAATTGTAALLTASALTTGIGLSIVSSGASQTSASALSVTQSGVTTGFTGSLVSITGASTTGTGNALGVTGVNTTAGDTVKIVNNAIVAGTSTAMFISHTTSVLGAGNSLLRVTSTSIDTGTTAGVLMDLNSTASTTGTQVLGTFAALTTGIGVSIVDSSANASARQVIKSSVTNASAILSEPVRTSNVALQGTGSKFTKHLVLTDGTKVTTIWLSTDATSPNTALSGTVGDICLNGPSGRSFYCTGTTNWTASNA